MNKKADIVYNKFVSLVKRVDELRKRGYLLINEEGNVEMGQFVFESSFNEKCISLLYDSGRSKVCLNFVVYNECSVYGESSFLKEVTAAYNDFVREYRLIEPKHITNLYSIIEE